MELLSPAGNRDALTAAVACGADAVYLGYTAFGARSYAGNFDADGLKEAVEYAHERGRKIYVTVNTLVKQCEKDDLCDVLELLVRCGVDAALVQDLGVVRIARERFPELTLHSSTQMTIHNAQGARLMQSLGFSRVVPARECTLEELRRMADTGVEVEAFAHGALCVAVSGQCLFSSMIGGRSGNRGRCAQPCRLPYGLEDGTSGYLLSTKDLMLIDRIPQLRDAGVFSFKLEGRMKRPEYVGVITRAYREALDAAEAYVPYHPDQKTIDALRQVFNRGGFTEGYALSKSNAALMSWERPNHWGVYMGRVTGQKGQLTRVLLDTPLHNGDGLQIRGRQEIETTYSGPEVMGRGEATVRIAQGKVNPGDAVYRLTDALQMQEIREYIKQEPIKVPLDAKLTAMPGDLPRLELRDDDGHCVEAFGEQQVESAQQRALDAEYAKKQLSKLGGTPYALRALTFESENAFLTAGMLNNLRRDALAKMKAARTEIIVNPGKAALMPAEMPESERLLIVQSENLEEMPALMGTGADVFYWSPQEVTTAAMQRALDAQPEARPVLVLPGFVRTQELEALHAFVLSNHARLAGVVINNVGQLELDWGVPCYGGQGLNVMNADCAAFCTAMGAKRLTASCELSHKELGELMRFGGNYEIEAYGRTLLMLLSHCPRRTKAGHEAQDTACAACVRDGGRTAVYTDRKGYQFPARRLRMDHGCLVRLYNSVVTDMAKAADKLRQLNCSLRLCFTDETPEERMMITKSYRSLMDNGCALHTPAVHATAGHLARGVE
ncbi:MAG: U32 family peptidase [Clostridia bacterium]|nr:U32 family peptidase [Clostridia bacterium]